MMRIEQLCDAMVQNVLRKLGYQDCNSILMKFGHNEDISSMEVKYDIHFKNSDLLRKFETLWKEEVVKFGLSVFPLNFDVSVEDDESDDFVSVGFFHWDVEDLSEYNMFIEIVEKGISLGYSLEGCTEDDFQLFTKGVLWGPLEVYKAA